MSDFFEIQTISKGNVKITEYAKAETDEVEKIFVQNGILGFFVTPQEMKDLFLLLNYYINIEDLHSIE
jgi:hypothetical protein